MNAYELLPVVVVSGWLSFYTRWPVNCLFQSQQGDEKISSFSCVIFMIYVVHQVQTEAARGASRRGG